MKKVILSLVAMIVISVPLTFAQSGSGSISKSTSASSANANASIDLSPVAFVQRKGDDLADRRFYASNGCTVILQGALLMAFTSESVPNEKGLILKEAMYVEPDGKLSGDLSVIDVDPRDQEGMPIPLGAIAHGELFTSHCSAIANRDLPKDVRGMFHGQLGVNP